MSDSDNLAYDSEQPLAKKVKLHHDTQSSDSSQEVNYKKKERQQRYRERNREKLKQREAERRQRQQNSEIIAELSISSNINRIELNNEKITDANSQSLSSLKGTQTSSVQENEQAEEKNAIKKKKKRQQRYREQNREKLKQREAERRLRQQNSGIIAESSISPNILECLEIVCEALTDDEISANSLSVVGLEETHNLFVEITERNERG